MKARIEQENVYKITIRGETFTDLKKCGEWEGIIKFSGPSGVVIVDGNESLFESILKSSHGLGDSEEYADLDIVKVSPSMIKKVEKASLAYMVEVTNSLNA